VSRRKKKEGRPAGTLEKRKRAGQQGRWKKEKGQASRDLRKKKEGRPAGT
jgi:hypothetical protein